MVGRVFSGCCLATHWKPHCYLWFRDLYIHTHRVPTRHLPCVRCANYKKQNAQFYANNVIVCYTYQCRLLSEYPSYITHTHDVSCGQHSLFSLWSAVVLVQCRFIAIIVLSVLIWHVTLPWQMHGAPLRLAALVEKSYTDPVAKMTYREVGIICAQSVNLLESLGEVLAQLRGITHSVSRSLTRVQIPLQKGQASCFMPLPLLLVPPSRCPHLDITAQGEWTDFPEGHRDDHRKCERKDNLHEPLPCWHSPDS